MNLPQIEQKILEFWEKNKIFEKSIRQRKNRPFFSFYDGPPFATGKPHYGHILATTIKDTVLRYWTMRGYQVPRRVGWDCHGLPVENLIEKELHIRNKREIEKYGIEKFNAACRAAVFRSVDDFEKTLKRVGRWADYKNAYATMDNDFIESVWWVLKQLWDKGLVYKDYRVSPYCPRCGTSLSNFEVNLGYRETKDPSIFLKFKVLNPKPQTNRASSSQARAKSAEREAVSPEESTPKPETYFLVWTTTPWTLPGNVALAVNPEVEYVLVRQDKENYILGKERIAILGDNYRIIKEFKGKDLIGLKYEPLYKIFNNPTIQKYNNLFSILSANFVSLEDGTGIVHIAPMYGDDDFQLGKKFNLPFQHTVDDSGHFRPDVEKWAGKSVRVVNPEIVVDLTSRNLLYKQEEITHTYPFCWRCDTPLLYYALDSWYIAVTKFKKQLVSNNKKIHWVPKHIKEGRFGNWLKEARDWAFSRSRFWGAPVPIWQCSKCQNFEAIGSIKELVQKSIKSGNRYFIMRHGEAENNARNLINCNIKNNTFGLTSRGRKEVTKSAQGLKHKKIDLIFASDFLRTKETAELVAENIGVARKKIIFDQQLREGNFGIFDGEKPTQYHNYFTSTLEKFAKIPPQGENLTQLKKRLAEFLQQTDKKYKNKNILIVSHEYPIWMLVAGTRALSNEEAVRIKKSRKNFIKTGEFFELKFTPLPRNENFILDLHRPYLDEIKLRCQCGREMKRVIEVFDCWFESGAMPYAQWHYPFTNKKLVGDTFPADFIAEGLDQTRGWFYTLHVLATALTLKNARGERTRTIGLGKNLPAFLNVIVNGLILDPQGRKLSKKIGNYPEPEVVFNRYGADSLRYFLLASTAMGEDYRFSEKGVEDVWRRTIMTFWNSYIFFKTYSDKRIESTFLKSKNILDKWILSRLSHLNLGIVKWMDQYELTKAARLFDEFIDDLSNWYIRRSRRRFQKPEILQEHQEASYILYYILLSLTKIIAPFTPFVAEEIYQNLKTGKDPESVHLCDYSKPSKKLINKKLEEQMKNVREIVAKALAIRMEKKIKVRQPLQKLKVKSLKLKIGKELVDLVKDEVNVKEVIFYDKIRNDVELVAKVTPELKEEGMAREIVRQIQQMRKEAGLVPKNVILVNIQYPISNIQLKGVFANYKDFIKRETNAQSAPLEGKIKFDLEKEINLEGEKVKIGIKKVK